MMQVTDNAKQVLQEILKKETNDTDKVVRIIPSSSKDNSFELILDTKQDGDQVVRDNEGSPVLVIGEDLTEKVEGLVFDYRTFHDGKGFSINRPETEEK